MGHVRFWIAFTALLLTACGGGGGGSGGETPPPPSSPTTERIALTEMGRRTYLGFAGGLYPDGSNELPANHAARGLALARQIQPLDREGRPSAAGKYVLLSIGMSNTTQEFCGRSDGTCNPWTFAGQAAQNPAVNRATLAIVNGAAGGQVAESWAPADRDNYRRIRDEMLAPAGLSEAQVQIVWMKVARASPTIALPDANADARVLQRTAGSILRALKQRYPNLRQVFVSSRIPAPFATTALNPEPYAYESGFAMKWLVEAQIGQLDGGLVDAVSGDLSLAAAPWVAWGPYLWDTSWVAANYEADGTHPSQSGEQKVGARLLEFFTTSPMTSCWFLAPGRCA